MERLSRYLREAQVVTSTSRMHFPSPFTREVKGGAISYRTDGNWLWLDDLPEYIVGYGVVIPPGFLADIVGNGFIPPKVNIVEVRTKLEWPPLK